MLEPTPTEGPKHGTQVAEAVVSPVRLVVAAPNFGPQDVWNREISDRARRERGRINWLHDQFMVDVERRRNDETRERRPAAKLGV